MASPAQFQATIIFADLIGASQTSDILDPESYFLYLDEFHSLANKAVDKFRDRASDLDLELHSEVRGDELFIALLAKPEDSNARIAAAKMAIEIAILVRISWLGSEVNVARSRRLLGPFDIGVGLHSGLIARTDDKSLLGQAINFGKRVEALSRITESRIVVSNSILSACRKSGLPVQVKEIEIQYDIKGFISPEKCYEISSQEIVVDLDLVLDITSSSRGDFKRAITENIISFPGRYRMAMELLLEHSFRGQNPDFSEAIKIGESMLEFGNSPSTMFRTARALHRNNSRDSRLRALAYYENAAKDPNFIWAKLDAAASYWRFANDKYSSLNKVHSPWIPGNSVYSTPLLGALRHCDEVIQNHGRHFYAYNLRALILSSWPMELLSECSITNKSKGASADTFIAQALDDLNIASQLNPSPSYIYEGTLGFIHSSEVKPDMPRAKGHFQTALKFLRDKVQGSSSLPDSEFWQPGFAVPGFCPPRAKSLENAWANKVTELDTKIN
jgi:class 3 adenylate cyclase